ncbi:hypothetical protein GCM10007981_17080 [Thermocladium modestius]|uniref:Uncharacterized protein n=1 Tax=Thermocladium modestius TaxID=62609 RepID=A0A830GXH1_9CREN|nr:hypothetical protein [Thermocladium modestius]GGP22155.1 hypothetical protein GCM10007981_17080 [Thermocladium modestius]
MSFKAGPFKQFMARVAVIGLNAGTAYLAYLLARGGHKVTLVAGAREARILELEPHRRLGLLGDNRVFTLDFLSTLMEVEEGGDAEVRGGDVVLGGRRLGSFDAVYTGTEEELVVSGAGDSVSSSDPFLALSQCMAMRAAGVDAGVAVDLDEWVISRSGCERRGEAGLRVEVRARRAANGGVFIGVGRRFVDVGGTETVVRRSMHEVLIGIGEAGKMLGMGDQRPVGFDYAWAGGSGIYVIGSKPASLGGMSARRIHASFRDADVEARALLLGGRPVHVVVASRGGGFTLRDAVDLYRWVGGDSLGFLFDVGHYQSMGRLRGVFSFIL